MVKKKTVKPLVGVLESKKDMAEGNLLVTFARIKREVKRDPNKALEMLDALLEKLLRVVKTPADPS